MTQTEALNYSRVNAALDYMAIEVETTHESNIKENFVARVSKRVDARFNKR